MLCGRFLRLVAQRAICKLYSGTSALSLSYPPGSSHFENPLKKLWKALTAESNGVTVTFPLIPWFCQHRYWSLSMLPESSQLILPFSKFLSASFPVKINFLNVNIWYFCFMLVWWIKINKVTCHGQLAQSSINVLWQCCNPPFVVQLFILFWVKIGYNVRRSTRILFLVD